MLPHLQTPITRAACSRLALLDWIFIVLFLLLLAAVQ